MTIRMTVMADVMDVRLGRPDLHLEPESNAPTTQLERPTGKGVSLELRRRRRDNQGVVDWVNGKATVS